MHVSFHLSEETLHFVLDEATREQEQEPLRAERKEGEVFPCSSILLFALVSTSRSEGVVQHDT